MKIEKYYNYVGQNGTMTSVVYFPGVPSYTYYALRADEGKELINGDRRVKSIIVTEDAVDKWTEVDAVEEV